MGFLSALMGISTNLSDAFTDVFSSEPAFNIDGAPMVGNLDINGNIYGVTQDDHFVSDSFLYDSSSAGLGNESSAFDTSNLMSADDCFASLPISTNDSHAFQVGADDTFSSDFSICDDSFSSSWDD